MSPSEIHQTAEGNRASGKLQVGWSGVLNRFLFNSDPVDHSDALVAWECPGSADWSEGAFRCMARHIVEGEPLPTPLDEQEVAK